MSVQDAFDYVIVGGGSAGAVIASRLSQDPSVTVALIEAGPTDVDNPAILQLDRWMELLESGYDWDYPVAPQEQGNSFVRQARAKVLGGCSSHNSCIAFWAPAQDLDEWVDLGAAGWGAADTLPLFARMETNEAPGQHHGRSGPVHIMDIPPADPSGIALLDACEQVGIPRATFNATQTVVRGANFLQINRRPDGTRASSSVSYLHPIMDRNNLTILTGTWASKIVMSDDEVPRARGVQVVTGAFGASRIIHANSEVILSAGAVDSPKLLMLSGIGPAQHLREHGVAVVVDAPGVGENLQDHPEAVIAWEAKQPMSRQSMQWWEVGIFADTREATGDSDRPGRPDLMMHYGSVPFDMHTVRRGYPSVVNSFCLTPNITHAKSRGTVRLASRDFRDKPVVDPRYFTDPGGHDMAVAVAGIKLAREIAAAPAMSAWAGRELYPGPEVQTDEQIEAYVRATHNTVYHLAGTVRMGAADDPMSPLTPDLAVKGVHGLRVADASVMPELTTVNPNLTTMVIGERCADLVASARGGSGVGLDR